MEPTKTKLSAKDFFLNLGATIALYTSVASLLTLLFTVIDSKFPKITNAYQYYGSSSISWPVAMLVVFFPLTLALMWVIAKEYESNPEGRNKGIHKWLTYLTLFVAGLVIAGDLVSVLYYFLDGQEITTAFLLKVLAILVVLGSIFAYYVSEMRGMLTLSARNAWRIFALVLVVGSILWGFSVLGSPRTQRLYKYDMQKVNDIQNLRGQIDAYYGTNSKLPQSLNDLKEINYGQEIIDTQTNKPYEYTKTGDLNYKLCAVFNKSSKEAEKTVSYAHYAGDVVWTHPEGSHCFDLKINPLMYPKPMN